MILPYLVPLAGAAGVLASVATLVGARETQPPATSPAAFPVAIRVDAAGRSVR